jgi:PPOX class probable F420-dependent enzyme
MAHRMTEGDARAFLSEGTRTGKLATVRADGSPAVAAIWFVFDGDDLVFTTAAHTVKGKALRRDPRAALIVDLEQPPFAYVLVRGSVSISEDLDEMLPIATRIAERYVGVDRAAAYGRRNAVPGELLVRLHPSTISAYTGISD